MIRMPTLEQARQEARMLKPVAAIAHSIDVTVSPPRTDQLPPRLVKLEFTEKVETE